MKCKIQDVTNNFSITKIVLKFNDAGRWVVVDKIIIVWKMYVNIKKKWYKNL